ncbi:toprim domain-containing protein [Methylobacterium marchantiae]|uniref:Toprim domain-containing protein n=1 Tax=Methylobacterium marchantiae TaxID=600331 RepID=A0ABW3X3S9_9HYPH
MPSDLLKSDQGAFDRLTKRGLESATLRRFGYFQAGFKGEKVHVAPYFDMDGEPAGQKLRSASKDFMVLKAHDNAPSIGDCQLFGRHVFGDRFDRKVVVTEGEIDAMSVAQADDFKYAVVSVPTGAKGAAKALKANYLWLDRFQEIILWFDNDEPGQAAVEECAKLFKVGKVRVAKGPEGTKDASDLLQAGRPGDITTTIYTATSWRPSGVKNAADLGSDVTAPKEDQANSWAYDWPWAPVQEILGPIKPGQVVYHVAGTGIGKSAGLAEIAYDLVMKQEARIAWMGFEDSRRDSQLRLLTVHTSKRLDLDQDPDEDMLRYHGEVFGTRRVELFDPESAEWTVDAILGYVRYCAKALDCQVIFIDPLSFIVAGLDASVDERRALDRVSMDLAAIAKQLQVHLQVSHHLTRPDGVSHEEGAPTSLKQVRGSGGIANFASTVIGHERNQQAEGEAQLITQLRSLKNRPRSRTGPMVALKYNLDTGRLKITHEPFPGPNKGGSDKGGRGTFPPANEY